MLFIQLLITLLLTALMVLSQKTVVSYAFLRMPLQDVRRSNNLFEIIRGLSAIAITLAFYLIFRPW